MTEAVYIVYHRSVNNRDTIASIHRTPEGANAKQKELSDLGGIKSCYFVTKAWVSE